MERQSVFAFATPRKNSIAPFRTQLLKWVGNKQRFAHEIASYFPDDFGTYFEPFLGSGGVLGALAPDPGRSHQDKADGVGCVVGQITQPFLLTA